MVAKEQHSGRIESRDTLDSCMQGCVCMQCWVCWVPASYLPRYVACCWLSCEAGSTVVCCMVS
jgi:hypothetical protein